MVGGDGRFHGFKGWQNKLSTPGERAAWSADESLGICVVGRNLKALDIDIDDVATVIKVREVIDTWALAHGVRFAFRQREGTPRSLLVFQTAPDVVIDKCRCFFGPGKTWPIELLGNRQQFLVAGTHKSGKRYEWYGGFPSRFSVLTFDQVDELWGLIAGIAMEHDTRGRSIRATVRTSVDYVPSPLMPAALAAVVAELRGLLAQRKSAEFSYDDWLLVAMGVQGATEAGGDGFELLRQWTADDPRFTDDDWLVTKWGTFNRLPGEGAPAAALGTVKRLMGGAVPIAGGTFPDWTIGQPVAASAAIEPSEADERRTIDVQATVVTGLPAPEPVFPPPGAPDEHFGYPERNAIGQVLPTIGQLVTVFRDPRPWRDFPGGLPSVRYDTFSHRLYVAGREIRETDETEFRVSLERDAALGIRAIPKATMMDAIALAGERASFDGMTDYLDRLTWDRVPRVAQFLANCCGAEDSEYHTALSRYLWAALVGRQRAPGCDVDIIPVLIGPPRARKSTLVHALAPYPDYASNLRLTARDDELAASMQGKIVFEIPELAGMGKREIDWLNSFITTRIDQFRFKYARRDVRAPRRGIMVATTNDPYFLPHNDALARRMAPVTVRGLCDVDRLIAERDQLYAEADADFRIYGVPWQGLDELADPARKAARQGGAFDTELAQRVETWVTAVMPTGHLRDAFTMAELCAGMDIRNAAMAVQHEIGRALRLLGFEGRQTMTKGHRVMRWHRKSPFPDLF